MQISPNILNKFPVGVLGLIFALVSASSAHAQILLTINDTNPNAVVITATGTAPATSVGSYASADGVTLEDFFTTSLADFFGGSATSTGLTAGSSTLLTDYIGDNLSHDGIVDLSLYNATPTGTLSFTTGEPAFIGTLTLNLGAYASLLPSAGTTGTLSTSFSEGVSTPTVIGQWEAVVPEPSTYLMVLGGLGVLAFVRRAARKA